jgi:hypothetical protein
MTNEELAAALGVRVQNTLLQLVREKKVQREHLGPTFVYLGGSGRHRRQQARLRMALLAERRKAVPTSRQIIATLVELIREPQVSREQIVLRCQRSGVPILRETVNSIFEAYDLDKKRGL